MIKDTGDVYAEASDKTTPAENYFVCAKALKSFVSDWAGLEEVLWDVRDTGIPWQPEHWINDVRLPLMELIISKRDLGYVHTAPGWKGGSDTFNIFALFLRRFERRA